MFFVQDGIWIGTGNGHGLYLTGTYSGDQTIGHYQTAAGGNLILTNDNDGGHHIVFKTMNEIWNPPGVTPGVPIGDFPLATGATGIDAIWLNNPVFAEMMKDLSWEEYSDLVDAANIAATPAAAGNLTGIPLYDVSIDSFIKNIRIGTRISYNSRYDK